jgi:Glycosyl hydrolase family 26
MSFSRTSARPRVPVTALLAVAVLLTVMSEAPTASVAHASGIAATSPATTWGVYVGPGAKNVAGAPAFAQKTGLPVTSVVDFPGEASWTDVSGASWELDPYRGSGLALEYSLPLMPSGVSADGTPWNLAACATGAYDYQWTTLGKKLVAEAQPATVIRPGWEFNGSWYRWSAAGQVTNFVGCFRKVVAAMRAVPGSRFTFDWNPNLGAGTFPAEQAYPGDAYVDVVGVDVYDTSWTSYPTPAGVTTDSARTSAWNWLLRGDHGLTFWSSFAHAHSKPLAITEWGVTWRPDGHGGGDNPFFVDKMLDFITDPANNVVSNHYFNLDTTTIRHDVTRADTIFPASLARLQARSAAITAATRAVSSDTADPAADTTAATAQAAAAKKAKAAAKAKKAKAKKAKAKKKRKHKRKLARQRAAKPADVRRQLSRTASPTNTGSAGRSVVFSLATRRRNTHRSHST